MTSCAAQCRFAKIKLVKDPADNLPLTKLGPDAFLEMPSPEDFSALMLKQRRSLKAILLDQSVVSGIGNWVADEVRTLQHAHGPCERTPCIA